MSTKIIQWMDKISGLLCFLNTELRSSNLIELDVCGRPLFANLVTDEDEVFL